MLAEGLVSTYVLDQDLGGMRGNVQSVFASSLNIEMGSFLVHFGGSSTPLSCVGASLPDEDMATLLGRVHEGDIVTWSEDTVRLYDIVGTTTISLGALGRQTLRLKTLPTTTDFGCLRTVLSSMGLAERVGLPLDARLANVLTALASAGDSVKTMRDCVSYLLGRGLGLTPSGDDVLCGYGVARWLRGDPEPFVSAVRGARLDGTTAVSRSYLMAMTDGHANADYCALAQALGAGDGRAVDQACHLISRVGHTSGCDGLLGLAAGMDMPLPWTRKKQEEPLLLCTA